MDTTHLLYLKEWECQSPDGWRRVSVAELDAVFADAYTELRHSRVTDDDISGSGDTPHAKKLLVPSVAEMRPIIEHARVVSARRGWVFCYLPLPPPSSPEESLRLRCCEWIMRSGHVA